MCLAGYIVFCCIISLGWAGCNKFPDGFRFGAATASYQVEGAWNVSDKSPSIWDTFLHNYGFKDTGDVACDSYHLWKRDIEIATELGLDFYRFSISWPRVLPSGNTNYISVDGARYYNDLINGLLEKNIQPVVTMFHWDLPQSIQDLGGWTSSTIIDWFGNYARILFTLYGDRVKSWITFNEAFTFCGAAYHGGALAPGIKSPDVGVYLCIKNVMMAHATAYRIYEREFRSKYNGKIGITNHLLWCEPEGEDEELAELLMQIITGLFSHPIFSKEGGWPPVIEKIIAKNSKEQGYPRSRLPRFTEKEKQFVRGTANFYGANYYTSRLVRKIRAGEELSTFLFGVQELNVTITPRPDWKPTVVQWFYLYNPGLRKQLQWLKKNYGDIEIFITENGYPETGSNLNDTARIQFYYESLQQVLLAINEDGVNVSGFTAWSLIDNLEWTDGFRSKWGLYEVDFEDKNRTRTPRASAKFYADVIKKRSLNVSSKYN